MEAELQERPVVLPEADEIQAARLVLRAARKRVVSGSYQLGSVKAISTGQLIEAIDAAEHALFNVLNTASSLLDCQASRDAIDSLRRTRAETSVA